MAVVLPNVFATAKVRSHDWVRDSRGKPVPSGTDTITERGPYPCNINVQPDGTYSLLLDPRMWPLRGGDQIVEHGGSRTWTCAVNTDPVMNRNVASSVLDHITATGSLDEPIVA